MKPNTLTRRGYRGKIYVKNTRKIHSKPSEKHDPDPEKIIPVPEHCRKKAVIYL